MAKAQHQHGRARHRHGENAPPPQPEHATATAKRATATARRRGRAGSISALGRSGFRTGYGGALRDQNGYLYFWVPIVARIIGSVLGTGLYEVRRPFPRS